MRALKDANSPPLRPQLHYRSARCRFVSQISTGLCHSCLSRRNKKLESTGARANRQGLYRPVNSVDASTKQSLLPNGSACASLLIVTLTPDPALLHRGVERAVSVSVDCGIALVLQL